MALPNPQAVNNRSSILILGSSVSGKNLFLEQIFPKPILLENVYGAGPGKKEEKERSASGPSVVPFNSKTDKGNLELFCVLASDQQDKHGGLRDAYFSMARAALILFDATNRLSNSDLERTGALLRDLRSVNEDIHIALCGIMAPDKKSEVTPKHLNFSRNLPYYEISEKNQYSFVEPLEDLARKLTGDYSLSFEKPPALACLGAPINRAVEEPQEASA